MTQVERRQVIGATRKPRDAGRQVLGKESVLEGVRGGGQLQDGDETRAARNSLESSTSNFKVT